MARASAHAVDGMTAPFADSAIDVVAAIEARGFIPGGAVARQLQAAFVAIRKKGKLPRRAIGEDYELEYGIDRIEIHDDAVREGARVLVVDDLIATGGTAMAAVRLLRRANANIVGGQLRDRSPRPRWRRPRPPTRRSLPLPRQLLTTSISSARVRRNGPLVRSAIPVSTRV